MKYFILLVGVTISGMLASCNHAIKAPDHIIIVIEENHAYNELVGSDNAPYINTLVSDGAVFTNSHGVTHPSEPNYLAIFSGSTQGISKDQCLQDSTPFTTPNLGAALINKRYTFKGFAQSMPSPGFLGCDSLISDLTGGTIYGRKHCPWVNWLGNKQNDIPDSLSQPMTAFPTDFNQLPTVAFVIPDMDHDMHNIGRPGDSAAIARGDNWLKENLSAYVEWAKTHNSLLILTFDEDDFTLQNHIPTIFVGANIKPGKYDEKINHYCVLNTIENMYGLPITHNENAFAIKDIWKN